MGELVRSKQRMPEFENLEVGKFRFEDEVRERAYGGCKRFANKDWNEGV